MATTKRPLLLSCDTEADKEQDLPKQPLSQKVSTWRGTFGYKPSDESSVTKAFKDAFRDLNFFGKPHRNDRPFELSLVRQIVWVGCWNFSVLGLLIYLCLLPLGISDDESPCQPDGEFRFGGIDQPGRFDWWAPRGFFQITLSWGRLSFGTAKLVDVIWDLVGARVKDHSNAYSSDSTITSRSSTGLYETCDEWEDVNNMQADCQLQRDVSEYIQRYGFEGKSGHETKHSQKTRFRNKTLEWPPLNVKAFYLPNSFYWNWTANRTDSASPTPLNPYPDSSALTFLVEEDMYNVKDVQAEGICQPIKNGESIEYQWGFSFLQLFVMVVLLCSWSIGLVVLWATAHFTLQRNDIPASPEGWKSLLKMTDRIKEQLMSAGMIWENLTDKELQDQIQLLLTGGPVPISSEGSDPGKPLPQGHFSIWRWIWRHKLRLVEGMYFVVFICLENTLRSDGLYYHFDKGTFCMAILLYATASLIIAYALGSTYRQRLWTLLTAIVSCFPFLLYDAKDRDLVLPGLCLGAFLAFFLGSSRGSRAVLFSIPLLCNYFAVLGFFISVAKSRQPYYRYI
ncbi:hypothetical protein FBULB1_4327 [Fusarium bulbicola]|nr:hypothetical protein FBULB1_4327 [Fusarium bulbicola]